MNSVQRAELIESYGKAAHFLDTALQELPREMWHFKPSPERWSIHEIIIHLADSEANSYVRCRCFVAEPGKTIMAYNQDLWATRMQYHSRNTDDALELFRLLRKMSYDLIKALPVSAWENTILHPEIGKISFDQWLEIYAAHIPKHIEQMRRNHEQWKQSR